MDRDKASSVSALKGDFVIEMDSLGGHRRWVATGGGDPVPTQDFELAERYATEREAEENAEAFRRKFPKARRFRVAPVTPAERQLERSLNGRDERTNEIVAFYVEHGWQTDSFIRNVASREYDPNMALVRVTPDPINAMHYVNAEYQSEGRNALAICIACIPASSPPERMRALLEAHLQNMEHMIEQTFARRFCQRGQRAQRDC